MKSIYSMLLLAGLILSPILVRAQNIANLNGVGTNTTIYGLLSATNIGWGGESGIQLGLFPGTSAHFLIGSTNNEFYDDFGNNDLGEGILGGNYNRINDWPGGHQVGSYIIGGGSNFVDAPSNNGGYATNNMIFSGLNNFLQVGSGGVNNTIAFSGNSTVADNVNNNSYLNIIASYASVICAQHQMASSNDLILNGYNSSITNAALSVAIGKNATILNNSVFFYSDGSMLATNGSGTNATVSNLNSTTNNQTIFIQLNGFCINTNWAGPYALNVNGAVYASSFTGDGSGLSGLSSANLTGTISLAQLPPAVVTNNGSAVTLNNLGVNGPLDLSSSEITSGSDRVFYLDTNDNLFVGEQAGIDNTSGGYNTGIGDDSLFSNTVGSANTADGYAALANEPSGTNNIAIGYYAGANYTNSESGNIDIGNEGVAGDNNVIRIGNSQTGTYVAGNLYASGAVFSNGVDVVCDRNAKENFIAVNSRDILNKVASLPLTEWTYKTSQNAQHIGPMAQDFQAAFGLNGKDDKHISVVDEGGVALAAIQGLNQELQEQTAQIKDKDAEIDQLQESVAELKTIVSRLNQNNRPDQNKNH